MEEGQTFFGKLKLRWNVKSNLQVVLILLVFACTGTSMMFLKPFVYQLFGVVDSTPAWKSILIYSLTILPVYQVVLLLYGFLFGQFRFFWEFEKKMFKRIFFIKD